MRMWFSLAIASLLSGCGSDVSPPPTSAVLEVPPTTAATLAPVPQALPPALPPAPLPRPLDEGALDASSFFPRLGDRWRTQGGELGVTSGVAEVDAEGVRTISSTGGGMRVRVSAEEIALVDGRGATIEIWLRLPLEAGATWRDGASRLHCTRTIREGPHPGELFGRPVPACLTVRAECPGHDDFSRHDQTWCAGLGLVRDEITETAGHYGSEYESRMTAFASGDDLAREPSDAFDCASMLVLPLDAGEACATTLRFTGQLGSGDACTYAWLDAEGHGVEVALHRFDAPPDARALDAWAQRSPALPGSTETRRLFALPPSRTLVVARGAFALSATTSSTECDDAELDALLTSIARRAQ